MSWNSEIEAKYMNDVETEKKVINDNLPIIIDRTPAAVLNLAGAAQQITISKNATQSSIDAIRRKTTEIAKIVDDITNTVGDITNSTSSSSNMVETKRQELDILKKTVAQGEVLDGIRKEQIAALHGKTDGSRHSSWMGLWRPLAQESRTGLFVASIAFALIALISLIYMFWDQIIQLFPASSSGAKPNEARNASAYFGGFFAKRFPNAQRK